MESPSRQRGTLLIVAALLLMVFIGATFALQLASAAGSGQRDRITERALAQAREALVAYAVDRPINAIVGPGYLPCPDLDDDGWAESTCGSMVGDSGQPQRLGRLPWKTLGISDLRDGYGERLWYAVSSKYKGLLNCGVSHACVDMSPGAALGTITVRDASGLAIHDGTTTGPLGTRLEKSSLALASLFCELPLGGASLGRRCPITLGLARYFLAVASRSAGVSAASRSSSLSTFSLMMPYV